MGIYTTGYLCPDCFVTSPHFMSSTRYIQGLFHSLSWPFLVRGTSPLSNAFQALNCKHHHCVFLVYFSSVTFQSSGSKTMCEKVRGRLRVWILTNTPGKQKRARAWVLWNCICAYWLCDCERNIMVSLSQFLKPNLELLTISSRCYCEDSIAGYSV